MSATTHPRLPSDPFEPFSGLPSMKISAFGRLEHRASSTSTSRVASRLVPAGRSLGLLLGAAVLGGLLGGCHKGAVGGSASSLPQGSLALHPNQGPNSQLAFFVEPNSGGHATNLHIIGFHWGRLADIRDSNGILRFADFVINENVHTDNDYTVEINPVSEKTTVTVQAVYSSDPDSDFVIKVRALEGDLTQIADKSLDPSELPPYPLVPRNAALILQFNDLVDTATISADTIKVLRGYPPEVPFDARLIPDVNHGDLAEFDNQPGLEFYSTRVIIDTTVSTLEAAQTSPPLPVNSVGLPASLTQSQPNVALRLPTIRNPDFGQFSILANPSGHGLSSSGNGTIDFQSPTRDVLRAMRSGGSFAITGDANNGFLVDDVAPNILGIQAVTITNVADGPTPETFICDLDFVLGTCAAKLLAGDVIQEGNVYAEVICPPFQTCPPDSEVTGDQVGTIVQAVYFRIIASDPSGISEFTPGAGQVSMRFHAGVPNGKYACFVRFPGIGLPPDQNVPPTSSVIVRFTEPMDPLSLTPFDSMTVVNTDPAATTLTAYNYVVGAVAGATDLREFTFTPVLPFHHTVSTAESFYLSLLSGDLGPTDLAGNQLGAVLPPVRFRIDPTAATQNTGGFALRFTSTDEISNLGDGDTSTTGAGKNEFRGQFLLDPIAQVLKPRPVTHFSAAADRTEPVPSIMPPFGPGVQTPLSRFGSKLQALWRYCDMGFSLFDEPNFNVDIEGLNWSPIGGNVNSDHYTRFEMSLAHCKFLPDESLDANLLPAFPNSGLVSTYATNQADPINDPLRKVYPVIGGPTGYTVIPSDVFTGGSGTKFFPWPMNRNTPPNLKAYYTFRDTALPSLGAPSGCPGAELPIVVQVTGQGTPSTPFPANLNRVPTIGLPLLMEFRCYPDNGASGLNAFDISLATASSPQPNFRAFATGNGAHPVDPDTATSATGGFNPNSTPPGAVTPGVDNSFYIGQLDLVTRISRVHSIWFSVGQVTTPVQYGAPVIEPRPQDQPEGTQVVLHFRGAVTVTSDILRSDAGLIDAYGDLFHWAVPPATNPPASIPTFLNSDSSWKTSLTALNTAPFFQVRITFISNPQTNLSPELSALGFTYRK